MIYVELYPEYLEHHGIDGMKWGQRNGPPYPITAGNHSTAEKKANPSLVKKAVKAITSGAKKAYDYQRLHSKNPKRLTDTELKFRIERLRNEEEYRKLSGKKTKAQKTELRLAAGRAFAISFMTKVGGRVGSIGTNINKKIGDSFLRDKLEREARRRKMYVEKSGTLDAKAEYNKKVRDYDKAAEERYKQSDAYKFKQKGQAKRDKEWREYQQQQERAERERRGREWADNYWKTTGKDFVFNELNRKGSTGTHLGLGSGSK